jgi:hypothetical protein
VLMLEVQGIEVGQQDAPCQKAAVSNADFLSFLLDARSCPILHPYATQFTPLSMCESSIPLESLLSSWTMLCGTRLALVTRPTSGYIDGTCI